MLPESRLFLESGGKGLGFENWSNGEKSEAPPVPGLSRLELANSCEGSFAEVVFAVEALGAVDGEALATGCVCEGNVVLAAISEVCLGAAVNSEEVLRGGCWEEVMAAAPRCWRRQSNKGPVLDAVLRPRSLANSFRTGHASS